MRVNSTTCTERQNFLELLYHCGPTSIPISRRRRIVDFHSGPLHGSSEFSFSRMSFSVGNPSPIGLVGFALAAMFLGLFEAGLLEPQGKEIVTSYGFWAAGLGQVFTGVIHLLAHNNTFAYLVFTFYGLVWLTICTIWDRVYLYKNYDAHGGGAGGGSPLVGPPGYHGAHSYPDAECLFLCLVGGVSAFLTAIALRHNKALPTALFFVTVRFWKNVSTAMPVNVSYIVYLFYTLVKRSLGF